MSDLRLIGYRHSVYTRAVRMALAELTLDYNWQDVDPFQDQVANHPFGHVPVLETRDLRIYETWAILTYLEARFRDSGPNDHTAKALYLARAAQVASMVNAYAYWPLVRQVYAHAVFAPAMGEVPNDAEIAAGFAQADRVLDAFEEVAEEAVVLNGTRFGPADWILFPMIDAFRRVPDARTMLQSRPKLNEWWTVLSERRKVSDTFTALDGGPKGSVKKATR